MDAFSRFTSVVPVRPEVRVLTLLLPVKCNGFKAIDKQLPAMHRDQSAGVSMQANLSFLRARVLQSIRCKTAHASTCGLVFLLSLLLASCLLCGGTETAAPALTITPALGPPTTSMAISGSGFDPYAAVDIYFDAAELAVATTNGAGVFGAASVNG